MSQRVLITGIGGFLGGYVAAECARRGWQVFGLDAMAARRLPEGVIFRQGQLPGPEIVESLREWQPTALIHCAGRASVPQSFADPGGDFQHGVVLTFSMLEALRRHAPGCRFVLLSSAAVYGDPESLPVCETSRVRPLSPYGYHKRQCELLVEEYAALHGIRGVSARVFSAYGPGLRRQVVWDICSRSLREGRLALKGTGCESRDFIHAADVASALVCLIERADARGETINVAAGRETTIAELASLLLEYLRLPFAPEFDGVLPGGDPANWRADIARLSALGFKPSVSLEAGLAETAAWCLEELRAAGGGAGR
jgi:UDP-glucose 4-epimerase